MQAGLALGAASLMSKQGKFPLALCRHRFARLIL